jgi:hypothetical protein
MPFPFAVPYVNIGIKFFLIKFKELSDEGNEIETSQLGLGFQRKGIFHCICSGHTQLHV